jgi:hypothetical protein
VRRTDAERLALLEAEVAELRGAVAEIVGRSAQPDQREAMLLRAAWRALEVEPFLFRRLLELAEQSHRIALATALRAFGVPVPFPPGERVPGVVLANLVGKTVDGITLREVKRTGAGMVYRLERVSTKHAKHEADDAGFSPFGWIPCTSSSAG